MIPSSDDEARYLRTCNATFKLLEVAWDVRRPSRLTWRDISGRVCRAMYSRLPTRDWYRFWISGFDSSSFISECYGDTSNILILNCIKIIDTYNTS